MENYFLDIHTHILPGMDDGSKTPEMSLLMLEEEEKQGISGVILTPHFYAQNEDPGSFLYRREKAFGELKAAISDNSDKSFPELYLGAEVAYFTGMSIISSLRELRIANGDFILVEMPFRKWSRKEYEELLIIKESRHLTPIIAHIERYKDYQNNKVLEELRDNGILFQSNSEYIADKKTEKKAMKLICEGFLQLPASDCHNLSQRAPNIEAGIDIIKNRISPRFLDDFSELCRSIVKR